MAGDAPRTREIVAWNGANGGGAAHPGMSSRPRRSVAVVTCMDTRIVPVEMLGIAAGDVHLIRNAGAIVTDDVVRSLMLSQVALGTEEVMVIGHTRCGLEGMDERSVRTGVEHARGRRPLFELGGFSDVANEVRDSVRALERSPYLDGPVTGWVFDVDTGRLNPV